MTGLNLLSPRTRGQSPALVSLNAQAPQVPAAIVAVASPALPPAPERMSLNHWRGKERVIAGDRLEIETANASSGSQLVLDLKVPGAYPGERDHIEFYKAVASSIWLACPETEVRSQAGRMVVAHTPETREAIERAVQQVRTLSAFIQVIGGNVGHVCRMIADQPQMADYLDSVLGGSPPRFFSPVPSDPGKESARLDPETVMLLGDRFAAANRPDLQLALYDVALPNCMDFPARNDLCQQWISLNNRANFEHIEDAEALRQQASVLCRLLVFSADGLADEVLAALEIQRDLVLDRLADSRPLSVTHVKLLLGQKCGWRFDGKEGDHVAVKAFEALIRHHREQGNGAKAAEELGNLKSLRGSPAREAVERLNRPVG
jgi:hypothetical protein